MTKSDRRGITKKGKRAASARVIPRSSAAKKANAIAKKAMVAKPKSGGHAGSDDESGDGGLAGRLVVKRKPTSGQSAQHQVYPQQPLPNGWLPPPGPPQQWYSQPPPGHPQQPYQQQPYQQQPYQQQPYQQQPYQQQPYQQQPYQQQPYQQQPYQQQPYQHQPRQVEAANSELTLHGQPTDVQGPNRENSDIDVQLHRMRDQITAVTATVCASLSLLGKPAAETVKDRASALVKKTQSGQGALSALKSFFGWNGATGSPQIQQPQPGAKQTAKALPELKWFGRYSAHCPAEYYPGVLGKALRLLSNDQFREFGEYLTARFATPELSRLQEKEHVVCTLTAIRAASPANPPRVIVLVDLWMLELALYDWNRYTEYIPIKDILILVSKFSEYENPKKMISEDEEFKEHRHLASFF